MRLTDEQRAGIVDACRSVMGDKSFALYIFGSRVDDHAKGGDIDLLLLVEPHECYAVRLSKHILLRDIKARIGEQKIDFVIATQDAMKHDPFLQQISSSLILLASYPA